MMCVVELKQCISYLNKQALIGILKVIDIYEYNYTKSILVHYIVHTYQRPNSLITKIFLIQQFLKKFSKTKINRKKYNKKNTFQMIIIYTYHIDN